MAPVVCRTARRRRSSSLAAAAAAVALLIAHKAQPTAAAAGATALKQAPAPYVFVCTSRSCKKAGSATTHALFRDVAPPTVEVEESGCHGQCGKGPNVVASGSLATGVYKPTTVAAILESHCGVTVSPPLITAYKAKMYADQALHDGHAADALAKVDAALAAADGAALSASPHALCSAHLTRSEALTKLARAGGGIITTASGGTRRHNKQELLSEAVAAARAAVDAQPARQDVSVQFLLLNTLRVPLICVASENLKHRTFQTCNAVLRMRPLCTPFPCPSYCFAGVAEAL